MSDLGRVRSWWAYGRGQGEPRAPRVLTPSRELDDAPELRISRATDATRSPWPAGVTTRQLVGALLVGLALWALILSPLWWP